MSCAADHIPVVLLKHFNLSPTHLTTSLSFFPSCSTLFPKLTFKGLAWHILLPNSKYIQSNNQHYCCQVTQARNSASGERFPRISIEINATFQSGPLKDTLLGFPGGSVVKNLPVNAGYMGLIPGLERWDPTCLEAAGPVHHNYWATNYWSLNTLESALHDKRTHHNEKPMQNNHAATKTQYSQKYINTFFFKKKT